MQSKRVITWHPLNDPADIRTSYYKAETSGGDLLAALERRAGGMVTILQVSEPFHMVGVDLTAAAQEFLDQVEAKGSGAASGAYVLAALLGIEAEAVAAWAQACAELDPPLVITEPPF